MGISSEPARKRTNRWCGWDAGGVEQKRSQILGPGWPGAGAARHPQPFQSDICFVWTACSCGCWCLCHHHHHQHRVCIVIVTIISVILTITRLSGGLVGFSQRGMWIAIDTLNIWQLFLCNLICTKWTSDRTNSCNAGQSQSRQRRAIHFHHLKKTIHCKSLDYRKHCILYIEKIGRVFMKKAQRKILWSALF